MKRRWPVLLLLLLVPASLARPQRPALPGRTTEIKLTLGDDVHRSFGTSVALDRDTALVGATADADNGPLSGSTYVLVRSEGVWAPQAKLLPHDGAADAYFGQSVALDGDTALVGATKYPDSTAGPGAVYVFVRSGGAWTEQAKLLPRNSQPGDGFGYSVSVEDDTALIGAFGDDEGFSKNGAAYVFVRSGSTWTQQAKLLPHDWGGQFGRSVSLSGDSALVGAPTHSLYGAAYIFVRDGSAWTEQTKLEMDYSGDFDGLGRAVALSGDVALIGAPVVDFKGSGPGEAWIFRRTNGIWNKEAKLLASDGTEGAFFGGSVSVSSDTALISAWVAGKAYLFVRRDDGWVENAILQTSEGAKTFGHSVSMSKKSALVGYPGGEAAFLYEPGSISMSVAGSCPGPVTVVISNAPAHSEVAIVSAAGATAYPEVDSACSDTVLEIEAPLEIPPLFLQVDGTGSGSARVTLRKDRCWLQALALETCETSAAVRAQSLDSGSIVENDPW